MKYQFDPMDTQFIEHTITEITRSDGGIHFGFNGMGVWLSNDQSEPGVRPPEIFDILRIYGKGGWGDSHRGICWRTEGEAVCVGYYLAPEQAEERDRKQHEDLKRQIEERRAAPIPQTGHPIYEWTDDMSEISGFGGGYEGACRKMTAAGLQWLDDHPEATPKFGHYPGIYGVITASNPDAEALSQAVTSVCEGYSGAMHQAVIGHCLWIRANGWDAYVTESRERHAKRLAEAVG